METRKQKKEGMRTQEESARTQLKRCQLLLAEQEDLHRQKIAKVKAAKAEIAKKVQGAEKPLQEMEVHEVAELGVTCSFVPAAVHVAVQVLSLAAGLPVEHEHWQSMATKCEKKARGRAIQHARDCLRQVTADLDGATQKGHAVSTLDLKTKCGRKRNMQSPFLRRTQKRLEKCKRA
jgi:hypothetical protein